VAAVAGVTAQTITFASPGNQTIGVATPVLTATSTSNLLVALSSTTPAVCTVSGTTLTLVAAGSCTLASNQLGNGVYAAATPVTRTFAVAAAPVASVAGMATGLWTTGAASFRTYVLVEPDGQMWGFPNDNGFGGVLGLSESQIIKGQIATAVNGNITGTFVNIYLGDCAALWNNNCTVGGIANATTLSLTSSLDGQLASPSFPTTVFTKAAVNNTASVTIPVGTWNMMATVSGSNPGVTGTLVVGADGTLTVASIGGCAFTGQLTAVPSNMYWRLTASSVSGGCSTGITANQINGVVFKTNDRTAGGVLHVKWHATNYSKFFWSSGVK
jgi:hypothetical protein